MGLPGAGKGTQAQLLAGHGWHHISVGGLVRAEVVAGSRWGQRAAAMMRRGDLVPSRAIQDLLARELRNCKLPVVIDGYPRRLSEADSLSSLFGCETKLIYFFLDIPSKEAILRLAARLACGKCEYVVRRGEHASCPLCSGSLVSRDDDSSLEVVQRRLHNFGRETVPLVRHYQSLGELEIIDALLDEVNVHEELILRIEGRCDLLV